MLDDDNVMHAVPLRAIHAELFDDPEEMRAQGCVIAIGDTLIDSGTFGPAWIFAGQVLVDVETPELKRFIGTRMPGTELVYVYPTRRAWLDSRGFTDEFD